MGLQFGVISVYCIPRLLIFKAPKTEATLIVSQHLRTARTDINLALYKIIAVTVRFDPTTSGMRSYSSTKYTLLNLKWCNSSIHSLAHILVLGTSSFYIISRVTQFCCSYSMMKYDFSLKSPFYEASALRVILCF